MAITTELNWALAEHRSKTDCKATAIYLGRVQMREFVQWAKDACYYDADASPSTEGKARPEYSGALVYEVSDDSHFRVA